MRKVKTKWTLAQWIAFGNRVKKLKDEIHSLIKDATPLCGIKELDELWRVDRKIDRFKSKMENIAALQVPDEFVTRIFYMEPLPENEVDARKFIQFLARPPADRRSPDEVLPKWYVPRDPDPTMFTALKRETIRKGLQYGPQSTPLPFRWDGLCDSFVNDGRWVEVTEAEAMSTIAAAGAPPERTEP